MHMGRGGLSHAQGPSVQVLRRTAGVFASGRLTPGTPRGGRTRRAGLLRGHSGGGRSMGMLLGVFATGPH